MPSPGPQLLSSLGRSRLQISGSKRQAGENAHGYMSPERTPFESVSWKLPPKAQTYTSSAAILSAEVAGRCLFSLVFLQTGHSATSNRILFATMKEEEKGCWVDYWQPLLILAILAQGGVFSAFC